MPAKDKIDNVPRYADMLSAMGTKPRLRIMRLLLSAHLEGMVVGDIGEELGIPNSTLSHHLEKLKNEDLVKVQREGTFLRYSANTAALPGMSSKADSAASPKSSTRPAPIRSTTNTCKARPAT